MKRINDKVKPVTFIGEGGERLTLRRSNMGEPYRDGIDFTVEIESEYFGAFLELSEARRMRDFLNDYFKT